MAWTTVAIAAALIVVVVARRLKGEPVPAPKRLFLLPVVVGAIGLQDLSHAKLDTVDVVVIAAGSALSLALGLLRGRLDRVSVVGGLPHMAWSARSVVAFAVNVLAKLALDAGGVAAGGTSAALGSSIVFSLGLALLGEAVVVWVRAQALTHGGAGGDRYRGPVQETDGPSIWPPSR
jgi:hypothetical protein